MPFLTKGKTNWKYILILAFLAVIVGGGILVYLKYFEKEIISLTKFLEIKKPEKIKVEKPEIEKETANWKTYRNEEYRFEFKYPDNFSDFFVQEPMVLVLDCDFSNFPLKCPRIVDGLIEWQSRECFSIENINSREFCLKAVRENLSNPANWNNPEGEKITINGMPWCLYKTGEGAMGHRYIEYYYTTIKDNKCLTTFFVVDFFNCSVYSSLDEKEYKKCEEKNNMKSTILNRTISTFNFFK
jgi:hypothetical protein